MSFVSMVSWREYILTRAELLRLAGVKKSHTTAYHPMGNFGTELFNRTLGNMLRSLPLKDKQHWPQQIQSLTFAYNATIHETTGYAPFFLMFGCVPRLPVDVMFKRVLNDPKVGDYDSHAKFLLICLQGAVEITQRHIRPGNTTDESEAPICLWETVFWLRIRVSEGRGS